MEWDYRLIDPGSRGLGTGGLRDLEAPPAVVLSLVLLPSLGSWDMADMLMQPSSDTCFPSPRFSHLNTCFIAHVLAYPYLSAAECPHLMGPLIGQGNKTPCSGLSVFIPKNQLQKHHYKYWLVITSLTERFAVCGGGLYVDIHCFTRYFFLPILIYFFKQFFITLLSPSHSKDYVAKLIFRLRIRRNGGLILMGNNVRYHLSSTSYVLGVDYVFFVVVFNIVLYSLFSQNHWYLYCYILHWSNQNESGPEEGGIQDKGNSMGKDLEVWKNIGSFIAYWRKVLPVVWYFGM